MHTNHPPSDQPSRWERLALASGAVAAALCFAAAALFIGAIVPGLPPLDAPAAAAAAFYAAQSSNPLYRLVSYIGEVQMVFTLLFFGGLYGVLRRAEGGSGSLAATTFAAGVALAIMTPFAILLEDHLLLGLATAGVDPVIVRSFDGIGPLSIALGGLLQALILGGCTALLLPHGQLPRWLGWSALPLAALSLLGTGTLMAHQLFPLAALGMLLFRLWTLLVSVALLRQAPSPQEQQQRVAAVSGAVSKGG